MAAREAVPEVGLAGACSDTRVPRPGEVGGQDRPWLEIEEAPAVTRQQGAVVRQEEVVSGQRRAISRCGVEVEVEREGVEGKEEDDGLHENGVSPIHGVSLPPSLPPLPRAPEPSQSDPFLKRELISLGNRANGLTTALQACKSFSLVEQCLADFLLPGRFFYKIFLVCW